MKKLARIIAFVLIAALLIKPLPTYAEVMAESIVLNSMDVKEITLSELIPEGTTEVYWNIENQIPAKGEGEVVQLLDSEQLVVPVPALYPLVNGASSVTLMGINPGSAELVCYRLKDEIKEIIKTYKITVENKFTSIEFKQKSYSLYMGATMNFVPIVKSSSPSVPLSYSSSNSKIARIDQNGTITALKSGVVTITCKALDGSGAIGKCKLKVLKEKKGWHVTKSGKKYYVYSSGYRAAGYHKMGDAYYYFDPSTRYMEKNQWEYVTIQDQKYKLRFGPKGKQMQDVSELIGKQPSYRLKVNTTTNMVTVYAKDGSNGYILPVRAILCSTGKTGTPTKEGTFTLKKVAPWHTLFGNVYGQYCTRITEGYLFHSVFYSVLGNRNTLFVNEYRKLGEKASHGCVRVTVGDAKWIYDNCIGSKVTVYASEKRGPLLKPKVPPVIVLPGGGGCDPTDPEIKN
ncbi:MAG: L,D-transpeptidase family protein [Lachnospiraceae bacterium]